METDHEFIAHFQKKSVSNSSRFRESAGKAAAVFSHKRKSSQETLSDREGVSSGHQSVQGKGETFFRTLGTVRDQFLKNKEIIYSQKQILKS